MSWWPGIYTSHSFLKAVENHDISTVLEFFEAPKPCGLWTKFQTFETGRLGWYAPGIGQRFQTVVNPHHGKGISTLQAWPRLRRVVWTRHCTR